MEIKSKRCRQTIRWCFIAITAVAVLGRIAPYAVAQNFNFGQFQREHLITHGVGDDTGNLAIYLTCPNWFGKPGYCPIRVRVVPRKGLQFKKDGQLQVVIGCQYYSPFSSAEPNRQVVVNVPIEAGTSEATGEVLGNFLVGDYSGRFDMLSVYAKLNGRKLRAQGTQIYNGGGTNSGIECKHLILISVESSIDDSRRLDAIEEMSKTGNWFSQEAYVRAVGHSNAYCDVRRMPTNWLCLSGVSGISIGFEDLARLEPKGLEAINLYILNGGYFSINKVASAEDVSRYIPIDLNRKVSSQKLSRQSRASYSEVSAADFEPPSLDLLEDTIWDEYQRVLGSSFFSSRTQYLNRSTIQKLAIDPFDPFEHLSSFGNEIVALGKAILDSKSAFAVHFASEIYDTLSKTNPNGEGEISMPLYVPHGFGAVYLSNKRRGDQSSAFEEFLDAAKLTNAQTAYTTNNRTARLSGGIGDDFWDWLIPSVGRTPAIPFLVFVVLFVGVGAPGVMIWSNRHKRRVWLVILMPIMAAVCTVFLFSYGVLKDGFGAVSRCRSLSFVDEKGNGMVWSRQSIFAATVSNQGLGFGEETYFAPMVVSPYSSITQCHQVDVEGSQKYLGVLPARLQTQFSISHPLRKMTIIKRSSEMDPTLSAPAVVNDSSELTWSQAVFVNSKNEFFVASDVAHGDQVEFTPSTREDAELLLQKEYNSQSLTPPIDSPSADQTTLAQTFNIFGTEKSGNATGQIVEEVIWGNCIGKSARDQSILTPGTFVVFCKDAPYLEKCVPSAQDLDGLHMIVGRW